MKLRSALAFACVASLAPAAFADDNAPSVTYSRDVAPILFANCASCHHAGEIGPMSLMNFDEVRPWAKSIRKAVAERSMPPWHPDTSISKYTNDISLSQTQIDTILAWIDAGAPQGDPADMPPAPAFPDTWTMGEPDLIFYATEETFIPAGASDREIGYLSKVFDTSALTEDLYITEWEIRGTAKGVIHHANLALSPTAFDLTKNDVIGQAVRPGGDYIGSFLPGCRPMKYPEGTAYLLPKGSHLGIQVHYVGAETDQTDRLMFGVRFAQGRVDKRVRIVGLVGIDNDIDIPPNEPDYQLGGEVSLMFDTKILSSGVHMHLRGSKYTHEAIFPDGTSKVYTHVPKYDFNWQSNYWLAEPVFAPKGTKIRTYAHYDNSANNPHVPDPNVRVKRGSWTEDEMLNSWSHCVLAEEKLGLLVKDGRVTGKADDAQTTEHPVILQGLIARKLSNDGVFHEQPMIPNAAEIQAKLDGSAGGE